MLSFSALRDESSSSDEDDNPDSFYVKVIVFTLNNIHITS